MRSKKYEQLKDVLRMVFPHTWLVRLMEIGTYAGEHSEEMILYLHEMGRGVEYFGFDLFEDMTREVNRVEFGKKTLAPSLARVSARLKSTKAEKIELHKGDTKKTLPLFVASNPEPMDLIFIDGGHSVETIESDWRNVQSLIGDRTKVVLDDYYVPEQDGKGCNYLVEHMKAPFKATVLPKFDVFATRVGGPGVVSKLGVHMYLVEKCAESTE